MKLWNGIAIVVKLGGRVYFGSDPLPVGGPNFSGQSVEPNQMFGWSLVDQFLPTRGQWTGKI